MHAVGVPAFAVPPRDRVGGGMLLMPFARRGALLLALAGASAPAARAQLPGGLAGSWEALSFVVTSPRLPGGAMDLVAAGGRCLLTIDPTQRFVLTLQEPGGAPEAETGTVVVSSPAALEFRGDTDPPVSFAYALAADTLTLSGTPLMDVGGIGLPEPTPVEATLERRPAQVAEGDGIPGAWVRSGGWPRVYRFHRPAGADAPAGLLVFLHGYGGNAEDIRTVTGLDAAGDALNAYVAYPEGIAASWAVGLDTPADAAGVDDVRFVRTLVAQLRQAYGVDAGRVFVGGFSQGGVMTHRLACELAEEVAAAAAVAGPMLRRQAQACRAARPVPFVMFHGTADASVPYDGTSFGLGAEAAAARWAQLNGCVSITVEALPDSADDGTTVVRRTHGLCSENAGSVLYVLRNAGHTWPGFPGAFPPEYGLVCRDISATQVMIEFFAQHARPHGGPASDER